MTPASRFSRETALRQTITVLGLAAAWVGLWRDISPANILGGLVVGTLIVATGVGPAGRGGVRLVPLVKLGWLVLYDLVTSTFGVALEVITPTDRTEEAIIGVEVPAAAREHFLLLIVAITLTPGTAVVDADSDTGTMYLHLLHADRSEATIEHVQKMAHLAVEALPVPPVGASL